MKIAITGSTKGIGKATRELLEREGHEVVDFSRTTQFDITDPNSRNRIVMMSRDCDVFINNAFSLNDMFAQTDMLYWVFMTWKNSSKLIINVGSNSSDGIKNFPHKYAAAKAALDKASEQLASTGSRCKVSNIRFGLVDTQMSKIIATPECQQKITPEEAAAYIKMIVDTPTHIVLKTLTVEPATV